MGCDDKVQVLTSPRREKGGGGKKGKEKRRRRPSWRDSPFPLAQSSDSPEPLLDSGDDECSESADGDSTSSVGDGASCAGGLKQRLQRLGSGGSAEIRKWDLTP